MLGPAPDEHLHVERLGRLHRLAERGIVVRHLAPAEQRQAFLRHLLGIDVLNDLPPLRIVRHEHRADRVVAGLGQRDCRVCRLADEELVRRLHQNAGAVAGARVGADCAAMLEIAEDRDRVLDDLVRLAPLMSAMKPTPQESFSWRGSNRPFACGTVGQSGNSTGESLTVRSAGEAEFTPTSNRCVLMAFLATRAALRGRTFVVRGRSRDAISEPSREGRRCRSPVPHGTACRLPARRFTRR
jgi:hypothetical protein